MAWLTDRIREAVSRPARRRAAMPDGTVVHAVGDVHGCAGLLDEVFALIERDHATLGGQRFVEVYLGDYFDRGPDSSGVVDRLIARGRERDVRLIRGNHDHVVQELLDSDELLGQWDQFGGLSTMRSYGVKTRLPMTMENFAEMHRDWQAAVPPAHRTFLEELEASVVIGDYLFVHAGIRPGVALERQSADDMMWIRKEFLNSTADHGKVVVHGHTPVPEPELKANRINLDTGAFSTGRLTCLRLQGTSQEIIS